MADEMHRIDCDSACGFMVQSHDQQEAIDIARMHVKSKHHMNTSEEDMRERMKTVQ